MADNKDTKSQTLPKTSEVSGKVAKPLTPLQQIQLEMQKRRQNMREDVTDESETEETNKDKTIKSASSQSKQQDATTVAMNQVNLQKAAETLENFFAGRKNTASSQSPQKESQTTSSNLPPPLTPEYIKAHDQKQSKAEEINAAPLPPPLKIPENTPPSSPMKTASTTQKPAAIAQNAAPGPKSSATAPASRAGSQIPPPPLPRDRIGTPPPSKQGTAPSTIRETRTASAPSTSPTGSQKAPPALIVPEMPTTGFTQTPPPPPPRDKAGQSAQTLNELIRLRNDEFVQVNKNFAVPVSRLMTQISDLENINKTKNKNSLIFYIQLAAMLATPNPLETSTEKALAQNLTKTGLNKALVIGLVDVARSVKKIHEKQPFAQAAFVSLSDENLKTEHPNSNFSLNKERIKGLISTGLTAVSKLDIIAKFKSQPEFIRELTDPKLQLSENFPAFAPIIESLADHSALAIKLFHALKENPKISLNKEIKNYEYKPFDNLSQMIINYIHRGTIRGETRLPLNYVIGDNSHLVQSIIDDLQLASIMTRSKKPTATSLSMDTTQIKHNEIIAEISSPQIEQILMAAKFVGNVSQEDVKEINTSFEKLKNGAIKLNEFNLLFKTTTGYTVEPKALAQISAEIQTSILKNYMEQNKAISTPTASPRNSKQFVAKPIPETAGLQAARSRSSSQTSSSTTQGTINEHLTKAQADKAKREEAVNHNELGFKPIQLAQTLQSQLTQLKQFYEGAVSIVKEKKPTLASLTTLINNAETMRTAFPKVETAIKSLATISTLKEAIPPEISNIIKQQGKQFAANFKEISTNRSKLNRNYISAVEKVRDQAKAEIAALNKEASRLAKELTPPKKGNSETNPQTLNTLYIELKSLKDQIREKRTQLEHFTISLGKSFPSTEYPKTDAILKPFEKLWQSINVKNGKSILPIESAIERIEKQLAAKTTPTSPPPLPPRDPEMAPGMPGPKHR